MKEIKLVGEKGEGKRAILDDEDYEKYKMFDWYLGTGGYAVGRISGNKKIFRLHRLIMNCPVNLVVDHLNGDRLDNRKKKKILYVAETYHKTVW